MTQRDRIVVLVLVVIALVAGGYFTVLKPRRDEAADLRDQVATAQTRLDAANQAAAAAERVKAGYDGDYAAVAKLGKAVPVDDDVPSLVFQLESAAQRAKIDFRSIELSSNGGAATAAAATPSAQAAAVQQASSQNAPGASTTPKTPAASATASAGAAAAQPVAATQMAAAALPPGAVVGSAGFPTMPFDFGFEGSFFDLEGFLHKLDRFTKLDGRRIDVRGRLLTVDGLALNAGPKGFPQMTATIHATGYLLPADQGLTAGASPIAPTTVPTATTSTGGATSTPTPTAAAVSGGR
jgi:type II secretory pathway pseudopilin PulG